MDRKTFNGAQTESIYSRNGVSAGLTCNSTKRMYGKIASGVLYSAAKADHVLEYNDAAKAIVGTTDNRAHMAFGTIFQPDDLDDIADFKLGERYKVSLNNAVEATATAKRTQSAVSSGSYHTNTKVALSNTSDSKDDEYLYVVGYGDIVVPHNQVNGAGTFVETIGCVTITGCVHFEPK